MSDRIRTGLRRSASRTSAIMFSVLALGSVAPLWAQTSLTPIEALDLYRLEQPVDEKMSRKAV